MHYYIGLTVLDSQTQLTDSDLEALAADVWTKVEAGDIVGVSIEKAQGLPADLLIDNSIQALNEQIYYQV